MLASDSLKSVSVGLFTPINWSSNPENCLFTVSAFADLYFLLPGRSRTVVEIDSLEKDYCKINFNNFNYKEPLWVTIAKVISYATIILPLIAFAIKAIVRCIYTFKVVDDAVSLQSEDEEGVSKKLAYSATQPAKIQVKNLDALENIAKEAGFPQGLQGNIVHGGEVITVKTAISNVIDFLNRAPRSGENHTLICLSKDQLGFWTSDLSSRNSPFEKILTILEANGAISHHMFCLPKEILVWV